MLKIEFIVCSVCMILALAAPAFAQAPPIPNPEIATVDDSTGAVKINWKATEAVAADPKAMPYLRDCARLMLAIRDRRWKPLH